MGNLKTRGGWLPRASMEILERVRFSTTARMISNKISPSRIVDFLQCWETSL